MLLPAIVLAGLFAALLVYFLVLEMFLWTRLPAATSGRTMLCDVGRLRGVHDFWRMERVTAAAQAAGHRIAEGKPV